VCVCVCVCDRASPALDFPAPQVYREYPEVKVSPDQRETPASPAVPVHLGALDSMDLRDLKVPCASVSSG